MRGSIYNLSRYKQLLDFSGLIFERKITPTDFDMVIDFGGKFWVVGEFKRVGAKVPYGQRLAIENALNNHCKAGVTSIGLIAYHNTSADEVINCSELIVSEIWQKKQGWYAPRKKWTVRELIDEWKRRNQIS